MGGGGSFQVRVPVWAQTCTLSILHSLHPTVSLSLLPSLRPLLLLSSALRLPGLFHP